MSVLVEQNGGAFPLWLSPVQAVVIPVGEKFNEYGEKVLAELKKSGIRAEMDKTNETLGKKIRANKTKKIPLSFSRRGKRRKRKHRFRKRPRQKRARNSVLVAIHRKNSEGNRG